MRYLIKLERRVLGTKYRNFHKSILFIFGIILNPGEAESEKRYSCIVAGKERMIFGSMLLNMYFDIIKGIRVRGKGRFPFVFPEFVAVVLEIIHINL